MIGKSVLTLIAGALALLVQAGPATSSRDFLFFIDTSGSMASGGLFKRVQTELDRLVAENVRVGDRVAVYTFDADVLPVVDRLITSASDQAQVRGAVGQLQAKGKWTYLTRAFDVAARKLDELAREGSGGRDRVVYVLTDGKNEPPPSTGERAISFEDIIRLYRATYMSTGTHIYLVNFGSTLKQVFVDSLGKAGVPVVPLPPKSDRPIFGIVRVAPAEAILGIPASAAAIPSFVFSATRQAGPRDSLTVGLRVVTAPAWIATGDEFARTFTADSTHIEVQLNEIGARPREATTDTVRLVASARSLTSTWSVSPETLTVQVNVGAIRSLRLDLPATATLVRASGDSIAAEVPAKLTLGPGASLPVLLRLEGPGSQVLRVSPESLQVAAGEQSVLLRLRGAANDSVSTVRVRADVPPGVVVDSLSQLSLSFKALAPNEPPKPKYWLWGLVAAFALVSAGIVAVLRRPKFDPDVMLQRLNENGDVVETINPGLLQGALRGSVILSRDHAISGLETDGVELRPDATGIAVRARQATLQRSELEGPTDLLTLGDGEVFSAAGVQFRVVAPIATVPDDVASDDTDEQGENV